MAVANYYNYWSHNQQSKIYKWNGSSFDHITSINTKGANDLKHISIDGQNYLAIANRIDSTTDSFNINSKLYQWDATNNQFILHQSIPTNGASRVHSFAIRSNTYLAISNNQNGTTQILDSKLYEWSMTTNTFQEFQTINTDAAYGWNYFSIINGDKTDHYLAIANYNNSALTNLYKTTTTDP